MRKLSPSHLRSNSVIFAIAVLTLLGIPGITSISAAQEQATPVVIEASDQPLAATPSGDQVLRLNGPTDGPRSLDPAYSRDLSTAYFIRQLFRGLTQFDAELNPVPALAQRIEISPDGLEYHFDLRDGAAFQDGTPITADAVVFSFTRALDPETADGDLSLLGGPTFLSDIEGAGSVIADQADELSGITAVDADTIAIRLSQPRSTFLMKLASAPASIVDPSDVERRADWWRTPNGSGPFRVSEWADGDHLTLVGSEHFFGGKPTLSRIEFRLGANALQPLNLYESGQIDITGVDVTGVDRVLAPESGLSDQVTVTPLFAVDYIAFRTDIEPMNDPEIRRALQLGFPRAKVASVSYDNHVASATGLIPNGMLGRDWPADAPGYDLEAAKQAIADSTYGSAEAVPPIQIYIAGYAGATSLRDVIENDLGLKIEVINVEWADFSIGLSRQDYPAHELYWGADYPDPESMLLSLFGSESPDNYTGYRDEEFDALLARAAAEQDPDGRANLYLQAQQRLVDEAVIIPLYFDVSYFLVKPGVKGVQVTALGVLGLETIWLER